MRAKRQNEPLRRTTDPSDLSVQELKRLLGEKTEEKRSATNELSPFSAPSLNSHPDTDVQGGAKWRIIAKGGDIATEKFQIPRTDIAAKRLLFPTWLEEFCELSRFEQLQHENLLENFINEKKRNRRA
ncbi:hypothetical protein HBI81_247560 [Parastagonospora nodorum]|nr:hypothetical protein HBI81_247560 [Parastagonospora nodorum]